MADNTVKVHGVILSPPVRAVLIFCQLHSIPIEFLDVDMAHGAHKSPEYLAINPYGLVPAITHGDFHLGESGAIVYYLAEAFHIDSQWFPADLQQKAKINSSLHWHHTNTVKNIIPYTYNKVIAPMFLGKPPVTPEFEAELIANARTFLKSLDDLFATGVYIARTAHPTYADALLYCFVSHLELVSFDFSAYPALNRWRDELGAIQAVREVHEPFRQIVARIVQKSQAPQPSA
ncbi:unnamed protein product [Blepharisma stoltei]|uniref:Glutathione S-transferase n=1 Tax=Blepharisma stoltei TaxID=1481888 RepID=A0AAU9JZL6_9CILI|nr:unnamed protein product [Blepharisma stoltei]